MGTLSEQADITAVSLLPICYLTGTETSNRAVLLAVLLETG